MLTLELCFYVVTTVNPLMASFIALVVQGPLLHIVIVKLSLLFLHLGPIFNKHFVYIFVFNFIFVPIAFSCGNYVQPGTGELHFIQRKM